MPINTADPKSEKRSLMRVVSKSERSNFFATDCTSAASIPGREKIAIIAKMDKKNWYSPNFACDTSLVKITATRKANPA